MNSDDTLTLPSNYYWLFKYIKTEKGVRISQTKNNFGSEVVRGWSKWSHHRRGDLLLFKILKVSANCNLGLRGITKLISEMLSKPPWPHINKKRHYFVDHTYIEPIFNNTFQIRPMISLFRSSVLYTVSTNFTVSYLKIGELWALFYIL